MIRVCFVCCDTCFDGINIAVHFNRFPVSDNYAFAVSGEFQRWSHPDINDFIAVVISIINVVSRTVFRNIHFNIKLRKFFNSKFFSDILPVYILSRQSNQTAVFISYNRRFGFRPEIFDYPTAFYYFSRLKMPFFADNIVSFNQIICCIGNLYRTISGFIPAWSYNHHAEIRRICVIFHIIDNHPPFVRAFS